MEEGPSRPVTSASGGNPSTTLGAGLNDTIVGTLNSTIRLEAFLPPTSGMAAIPAPAFSPTGRAALTAAILGAAGWSL